MWLRVAALCSVGLCPFVAMAGYDSFPGIKNADIPGAPELLSPEIIMGGSYPAFVEKAGLSAPAVFDWDRDGKKDLLIGEFEYDNDSSNVRIYLNIGSDEEPKFSKEYIYATDTEGKRISVPQYCCIGFTPQFFDLNNDGYQDMITGQFNPGHVTWFRGSKEGFLPGVRLPQEGLDPERDEQIASSGLDSSNITSSTYWSYSSASFGDLDNDGDLDLIVGGYGGLRFSENLGTTERPTFGRREWLLDVEGNPLQIYKPTDNDKDDAIVGARIGCPTGDIKTSPYIVDWDSDGVLDLLVTNSYIHEELSAVDFFRGRKTDKGHRFEPAKALFTGVDGAKAIPGSGPRVSVVDWNNDGVNDLLIGASVATLHGKFSDKLSWEWEKDNGIQSAGKAPGRKSAQVQKYLLQTIKDVEGTDQEGRYGKAEYISLVHKGYVYVMQGKERHSSAQARDDSILKAGEKKTPDRKLAQARPEPVYLYAGSSLPAGETLEVDIYVTANIEPGWYIYSDNPINKDAGMVETRLSMTPVDGVETVGEWVFPESHPKDAFDIYEGQVMFTQKIKIDKKVVSSNFSVEVKFHYQTCNRDMCLPPATKVLSVPVFLKRPEIERPI